MANALYRQLPNNDWIRQDGGGPCYMSVIQEPNAQVWFVQATYDGEHYFMSSQSFTTAALAQTALNTYAAALNAGTA